MIHPRQPDRCADIGALPQFRPDLLPQRADIFRRCVPAQAAENLYDCLRPGGYICLGHSESMSRISPLFSVCRFPDAIVYQRPEADHG